MVWGSLRLAPLNTLLLIQVVAMQGYHFAAAVHTFNALRFLLIWDKIAASFRRVVKP